MYSILEKGYLTLQKSIGAIEKNLIPVKGCRHLFILVLFLLITITGNAATYYVSNLGNDSKAGTTPDTAWKTISKVNKSKFAPGDQILFMRDGVWREQLIVPSSGTSGKPITFGAYGSGNNPTIDGADVINGMTSTSSNIWQKTGVTIQPNLMYLNGIVGYPKTSTGACTSEGDWYWNSGTKVFSVYTKEGDPSGNVELGQRKKIVDLGTHSYITISNLTIQHSNEKSNPDTGIDWSAALFAFNSSYLTITGCAFQNNSLYGCFFETSSHVTINKNTFLRNGESYKNGMNVRFYCYRPTSNITFTNNQCNNSGGDGLRVQGQNKVNHITNVDIHGNHFDFNTDAGLYIQKLDSAIVYDNYFNGNGDAVDAGEDYAIGIASCDNTDIYQNTVTNQKWNDAFQLYSDSTALYGSAHNVRIFRNSISGVINGDCIGINVLNYQTCQNLQIYSNILDSADFYGIYIYHPNAVSGGSVSIFNNTFYENINGGLFLGDHFPCLVKNNIFCNNGAAQLNAAQTTTSELKTSNNLYYTSSILSGPYVLRYNSNYTMETITNFEASAKNSDPLFANPSTRDFTLQSDSPAIKAGVSVGLTSDILGNPIVGTPDLGAYEKDSSVEPEIPFVNLKQGSVGTHYIPAGQGETEINPMNLTIVSAMLEDLPLSADDEIAVFSGAICVGSAKLTQPIDATNRATSLSISASQADGSNHGYLTNDTIVFKIWNNKTQNELQVNAVTYRNDVPIWKTNGRYAPGATAVVALESYPVYTQQIEILKGYNLISTYVSPQNSSVSAVTKTLIDQGNLITMQDEAGNSFENWGAYGGWINQLGSLKETEGYQLQAANNCTLQVTGRSISTPLDISLKAGWNIISYPRTDAVNAMDVVQSLIDQNKLVKVQDEQGNSIENWQLYGGWKNGIGNLIPGKAYKVKMSTDVVLAFQKSYPKSALVTAKPEQTEFYHSSVEGNGTDHMNINITDLNTIGLTPGDELAAFDGAVCVATIKITEANVKSGSACLAASFSTDTQKPNGFKVGNPIQIVAWNKLKGGESTVNAEVITGQMKYEKNASVLVKMKSASLATGINNLNDVVKIDVFPNPCHGKFTVRLNENPEQGSRIDVLDVSGHTIASRVITEPSEVFNLGNQPSGLYLVKTTIGTSQKNYKLIIN